jgi:uncharacterized protein GlcG (DUF336 family)
MGFGPPRPRAARGSPCLAGRPSSSPGLLPQGFLLLGGGLPLRADEEVIGAVGVGGAPNGQLDEECARAGIDKAQASLN